MHGWDRAQSGTFSAVAPTGGKGVLLGIDVGAVRAETPAVAELVHLNNAGGSLPPVQVTEAMVEQLRLEERMGGYEAQERVADRLEGFYCSVARLLGARPEEVALDRKTHV